MPAAVVTPGLRGASRSRSLMEQEAVGSREVQAVVVGAQAAG
jgi:hypothetical protein